MEAFEWSHSLRDIVNTQDKLIVFTLALIMVAMVIDFLTGTLAARVNPNIDFKSKEGINGILRKLASIALLSFCIPLSILLPEGIGLGALQILYIGYLFFELKSILENFDKLGINTMMFKDFIEKFSNIEKEDKNDELDK
ncbi:phage holin family protein [Streptococcus sanguinis]|jgi:toxin secretion/phage lysis holin|uniref:phage holin family protein n=1 Tax=Streptococcus sanguinis TaxID=1305 RepID=UPI000F688DF4|nr:phage holin family protein [Streptococcus sanguinis]RSI51531.1 Holin family protein [Streptococcus sanguinis]